MSDQRAAHACCPGPHAGWWVTACQVATLVRADWLFLLTDVPCLYTANPSTDPTAKAIHEVRDIAALQASSQTPCLRSPPCGCCVFHVMTTILQ